ncbi:hypothetical protein OIU76_017151 [Salix suchowensis]|nr:hypothetical protein OIU76_017151 [Salix suchowensis]
MLKPQLPISKSNLKNIFEFPLNPPEIKAVASLTEESTAIKVKAVVTVKQTIGGLMTSVGIERGLDDIKDLLGKTLLLELVSAELDPKTELEKPTIPAFAHRIGGQVVEGDVRYEAEFEVPLNFGEIVNITCGSWVHSKYDNDRKRIFFTNKSYLPSETPSGIRRLREEELVLLRGNGQGQRKTGDRIYEYDVYNDIGNPDKKPELARPVFGGKEHPYPRRCRTGRPRCETDPSSEKRVGAFYVPRDEAFSEMKQLTFSAKTVYSLFHALVPSIGNVIVDANVGFPYITAIDSLFSEGIEMPPLSKETVWKEVMPRLFKVIAGGADVLRFEIPKPMERDKFFWFKDEEFARQTLAGLNPYSIKLVKEWPLKSELDPEIYGPPESAITSELLEAEIGGITRVEKAIRERKLFILDYHDLLLPFVSKVRELEGTTLYGSRTLFFLTPEGTLRPLAIELTRPQMDGKPQWKQVFTPNYHSTGCWLWRLAKAHVLAHDSGFHQLVSHWLRTHCVTEPYIIATNRQLSVMHPIFRLLHPHFRYTMEINALARESLINADGIIETSFSPGKYCMEICSAAYDKLWRFDREALPNDLISR